MKNYLPFFVAVIVALSVFLLLQYGYSTKAFTPTGPVVLQERQIGDFTKLDVSSSVSVEFKFADTNSLTVETHEDMMHNIITEIQGETLCIRLKPNIRYHNVRKQHVVVKSPNTPREVSISGAVQLLCDDPLQAESCSFHCSGASRVQVKNLESTKLDIQISGAGSVDITGKTESVFLRLSGASKLHASHLETDYCDVDVSGASNARLGRIDKTLSVQASGASRFEYEGTPTIQSQKVHGASKVRSL